MSANSLIDRLEFGDHVCSPVAGSDESRDVAVATIRAGFRDGSKILIFADDRVGLAAHLRQTVAGSAQALAIGQLQLHPGAGTYLSSSRFDAEAMVGRLADEIDTAEREGYTGTRIIGDLSGLPHRWPEAGTLIDYESQVNTLFADGRALAICHYNPYTFTPATWSRMVEVHPSTILPTGAHAVSRLRCLRTATGVRLVGEADLANRVALRRLLAHAVPADGPCHIDATGMTFADARAVTCLLHTAAGRTDRTTIDCPGFIAEVLRLFGAGSVPGLAITVTDSP